MEFRDVLYLAIGSPQKKRDVWKRHLKRVGLRHGFYIYQDHVVWKDQPFFKEALKRTQDVEGIPDPRSFVLQSSLRSLANVEGDLAECGVRQGRSTLFMLTADLRKRDYHLFDSFEGLSKPGKDDRDAQGRLRWEKGDLRTDEALTRKNLAGFDNVHFHVGWIPDTLGAVADRRFAFVHIDVDLYEPTRGALEFFYERTNRNGLIVCDDYGSAKCPGARKAFDEFFANRPEGVIELPTGQALVFKQ
jgi:O-methyltransferase